MSPTITTVTVSAMVGVLVGSMVHETFGGKRSSIGVHARNGQLMSFPSGVAFFGFVTLIAGIFSAIVSAFLTTEFTGFGALVIALLGVSIMLYTTSYSR